MNIKPFRRRHIPQYPTQDLFAHHATLLGRYIPSRWRRSKAAMGTLLAFVMAGAKSGFGTVGTPSLLVSDGEPARQGEAEKKKTPDAKIAPIFIHGEGQGAIGCVVMSPPVFLTENEAIQVIVDEFRKEKISIDQTNKPLPDLFFESDQHDFQRKIKHPLVLNIVNKENNLGVVFIGEQVYHAYGGEMSMSTVQDYDMIAISQLVKEKLRNYGNINAVVFYDPMVHGAYDYRRPREEWGELGNRAKEMLREQVSDFLHWMKKELVAKPSQ